MKLLMFDVDGTLVESTRVDSGCYIDTVREVLGFEIDDNWGCYKHVTDQGILNELLLRDGVHQHKVEIVHKFKEVFYRRLAIAISKKRTMEIPGATELLRLLKRLNGVHVAIATGGWFQSAQMKLASAGINIEGISVASSDDHYNRAEIMKIAATRCCSKSHQESFYFGDGEWDEKASSDLHFRFVGVGSRKCNAPSTQNFSDIAKIREIIEV